MQNDHGKRCDCYDCENDRRYKGNHKDNFDWNDVNIFGTKVLGYATGNPVTVATAETAKQIKDKLKEEVAKGKNTKWTNLPKDGSVPEVDMKKLAPDVDIDWLGWLGPYKWLILLAIVTILVVSFNKIVK